MPLIFFNTVELTQVLKVPQAFRVLLFEPNSYCMYMFFTLCVKMAKVCSVWWSIMSFKLNLDNLLARKGLTFHNNRL